MNEQGRNAGMANAATPLTAVVPGQPVNGDADLYELVGGDGPIHACPPEGGLMPCCGLTPFEVPRWDRITLNPALVTCTALLSKRQED